MKKGIIIFILLVGIFMGGIMVIKPALNIQTLSPANTTPTATEQVDKTKPVISSPAANSKVTSPLEVKGTVPPGWMFEGAFPVSVVNANGDVITKAQGKEVTPGSWSSGNSVDFTANLTFSTEEKSGFIVLEKDNPSGLPENAESYRIPITF